MNSKKSIKNVLKAEKSKTEPTHPESDSVPGWAQIFLAPILPAEGLGHFRCERYSRGDEGEFSDVVGKVSIT